MANGNGKQTFLSLVRRGGQRRKGNTTYEQMQENIEKAAKQKAEEISKQQKEAEPGKEFFDLLGRGS